MVHLLVKCELGQLVKSLHANNPTTFFKHQLLVTQQRDKKFPKKL